ncbi:hypothetical protein BsWGS_25220 [Bradybaena similaris]
MVLWDRGLLVHLYFLLISVQDLAGFFGLTSREPILTLNPTFDERMRNLQQVQKVTTVDLCNMLVLQKKQKRQCIRGKGVAETLVRASRLSALECQHQFQHERWNCSLADYRKHILRKGETSCRVESYGFLKIFPQNAAVVVLCKSNSAG